MIRFQNIWLSRVSNLHIILHEWYITYLNRPLQIFLEMVVIERLPYLSPPKWKYNIKYSHNLLSANGIKSTLIHTLWFFCLFDRFGLVCAIWSRRRIENVPHTPTPRGFRKFLNIKLTDWLTDWLTNQQTNQPTNQSTNQPTNQSANHLISQLPN